LHVDAASNKMNTSAHCSMLAIVIPERSHCTW